MAGPTITSSNAFWAQPSTEPKRAYRFLLIINGLEHWAVKKVTRPKWKVSEISHDYINHKFWYPGRVEWEPMTVTLVDPVSKDTTGTLMAMIMASGYRLPINQSTTRTVNKYEAVESIGSVTLVGLGGHPEVPGKADEGNVLEPEAGFTEKWELVNPWIQTVEMGEYSYSEDAILELGVTFRYDFAKYNLMNKKQDGGPKTWNARTSEKAQKSTRNVIQNASTLIAGN